MKIVLVNPPISREDEFGNLKSAGNIIPPLGIGYIAAVLEKEGYNVKIIDCAPYQTSQEELTEILKNEHPDIIGYTATTLLFYNAVQSAKSVKEFCSDSVLIIGGAHVTALPEETLVNSVFDIGVIGEGEYTILEVVRKIADKDKDLSSVKGIVYKKDGKIFMTEHREFIRDLDDLPLPARHLFPPLKDYYPSPVSYRKLPWAHMVTSRGCPYFCKFCDRKIFGEKFRKFSAERVVEEVENVIKVHGAREIRFLDDILPLDKKRFFKILKDIKNKRLSFPWTCQARVDNVDKEILKNMKEAGCWQILYGLESGSQKRLDAMGKGINLEESRKAVLWAKEVGINVRADFLVFAPGETKETFKQTVDFALSLPLDVAHFNIFTPLPGTEFTQIAKKQGRILHFDYHMYRIHTSPATQLSYIAEGWTERQIKDYTVGAHKKFYLRTKFLLRQLLQIRSHYDIQRYYRGLKSILFMY